jgi:hypothetical protein
VADRANVAVRLGAGELFLAHQSLLNSNSRCGRRDA